jgi:23S rRNA (adenine-N6)-dimethyltransferase
VPGSGRSRRAWGWHQLGDQWAERIVADAAVVPGQLVIDIGAGTGALTRHLLAAGAQVVAVELHAGRAQLLRHRFAGEPMTVLQTDALAMQLPTRPFRVVANPPYAISSALLRRLLAPHSRLIAADLILQRAVVRGYTDGLRQVPGADHRWAMHAGRSLPRRAFRPPPHVDSTVLRIRRR